VGGSTTEGLKQSQVFTGVFRNMRDGAKLNNGKNKLKDAYP
jgi:hypothetical protein